VKSFVPPCSPHRSAQVKPLKRSSPASSWLRSRARQRSPPWRQLLDACALPIRPTHLMGLPTPTSHLHSRIGFTTLRTCAFCIALNGHSESSSRKCVERGSSTIHMPILYQIGTTTYSSPTAPPQQHPVSLSTTSTAPSSCACSGTCTNHLSPTAEHHCFWRQRRGMRNS